MKNVLNERDSNSNHVFSFHSFKATNHDFKLASVDGSHHNVRGVNFVLATLRAGYLIHQGGQLIEKEIDPIKMEFIMNNGAENVGFDAKHREYFEAITGEDPKGKMEFDKATERIRTLLEWQKIERLIDKLNKDDLIIFDGSMISGEISTSHTYYHSLVKQAKEKGITLIGLSKDTSLSIDSASVPSVLKEAARKQYPDKNWFVQYEEAETDEEEIFFAKFTNDLDLIFRVDLVTPDHLTAKEVFERIGAYCFDRVLKGYPYTMQKIHDEVRISEMERDHCFDLFKSRCLKEDMTLSAFNSMFQIYHDQLDQFSYGR